jgi:hypothetical protein
MLTSQWASKNTITSPLASFAPYERVRIKPSRSLFRKSLTFPSNCVMYCSRSLFRCSESEHKLQTEHKEPRFKFLQIKVHTFSKCLLWNFTYLTGLMFISCRYKPTVQKLITLAISCYAQSEIMFLHLLLYITILEIIWNKICRSSWYLYFMVRTILSTVCTFFRNW